jgi:hypothetical protein
MTSGSDISRDGSAPPPVALLEGDVAGADPDAYLQCGVAGTGLVVPVQGLLDRRRGTQRVAGAGEGSHHPVAEVLDQVAPVRFDGPGDDPVVVAAQLFGGVLAEPGAQLGGSDQVGEDDDRRRAFHLNRAPRSRFESYGRLLPQRHSPEAGPALLDDLTAGHVPGGLWSPPRFGRRVVSVR